MENKINIAELLRNCPKGMELDCVIYQDVYFDYVDTLNIIHCYIQHETHKSSITFNQFGTPNSNIKSKCVIFPKGKTTWEGFQRLFVEGDVIYVDDFIAILSNITESGVVWYHCYYCTNPKIFRAQRDFGLGNIKDGEFRLATEEEKQKLFDAIRENGYRWNTESKTLEKLVEPKEDTDDRVVMSGIYFNREDYADEVELHLNNYEIEIRDGKIYAIFKNQETKNSKPRFKVGDKIKSKSLDIINPIEIASVTPRIYTFTNGSFQYVEIIDKDYELAPNKFDFNTLKPFEQVLVRCSNDGRWVPQFFAKFRTGSKFPFECTYNSWIQCVPYKGNEHLYDTTDNCSEFYRIWKDE